MIHEVEIISQIEHKNSNLWNDKRLKIADLVHLEDNPPYVSISVESK